MADENQEQLEDADGTADGQDSGDAASAKKKQDSGSCGLTCLVLIGYLAILGFAVAIGVVLVSFARA